MEHNLKKSEDTIQNQTADLQKDYYLYLISKQKIPTIRRKKTKRKQKYKQTFHQSKNTNIQ